MIAFGPLLQAFARWFESGPAGADGTAQQLRQTLLSFAQVEGIARKIAPLLFDPAWYAEAYGLSDRGRNVEAACLARYLDTGAQQGLDPTEWFNEAFYRGTYHDVSGGIAAGRWECGYQHYLTRGMAEHRNPNPSFSEIGYLGTYPDVLDAVRAGVLPSGFLHYMTLGKIEGRTVAPRAPQPLLQLPVVADPGPISASTSFAEGLYLGANHDVPPDGQERPGMRHWLSDGIHEDLKGTRARIPAYVEALYLRANTDISHLVGMGGQPSGYHHFLMYGASEGRRWAGSEWAQHEQHHLAQALANRSAVPALTSGAAWPLISVIVPVYNPATVALQQCIQSVRAQTYPHWELCLADDGSHQPETVETLVAAERDDRRIKVVFAARNGGISAASNMALAHSRGEFIALLDHDDLLAPNALLHVAKAFMSGPDVDLVYTDEAKLTENGEPFGINPKPGWSPELLLSTMYIGHLTAYRRSVLDAVGGFRSMFDGTQDYDLALRAAEVVRSVVHVPLPLYFWRLSASSTAGSLNAKPGVLNVQREALENTLIRRGQAGTVQPGHGAGHWTVELDVPAATPLVSIVIPTAGRTAELGGTDIDLLVNCMRSIELAETYSNYEFIVVHNDDLRPETLIDLAAFCNLRLVAYRSEQFNLSEKINLGVREAAGEFVLLLNDDMQAASTGMIRSMIGRMFNGVGVVGSRLLYANGTLQHAGVVWTAEGPTHAMIGEHRLIAGPAERLRIMHDCFGVSGACMFFRRNVYLTLGGFSPMLPTNYNDVDFCLRVRAKHLRVVYNPDVTLYHFESLSKSGTHFWELQLLLLAYPQLADPYFNITFSSRSPFYELRDAKAAESPRYVAWLIQKIRDRQPTPATAATIRFSIIMSVYQNQKYQMEELAATIFNQTYANWEWIIVDDGSTLPETLEWLEQIERRGTVTLIRHHKNQGIMAGYGAAFRAATGDYVIPVDADDFLTLDCLQVLATTIETEGYPEIVFSDEDKATAKGALHSPFLKPAWDPVLFTNICYVCHVCAIKRAAAVAAGAYTDLAASWCHDWDTLLRLHRAGARIVHVPEVLYSWRIHPGSTASIETGNKPATITSQKHVLDQHLKLTRMDRHFDLVQNELFPHTGIWRLRPRAQALPKSAILVIASPDVERLSTMLLDLARSRRPEDAVLIVGGAEQFRQSLDRLPPELKQALGTETFSRLREERTLSEALALCAQEGRAVVAVIDAGVARLSRDWIAEGLGMFAAQPDVGAVCGQVLLPNGRVAWRGGFRGFGGMAGSPDHGRANSDSGYHGMGWCQRTCDSVPSVCFFARTGLLQAAVSASGDQPLALRELAGQLTVGVWQAGLRVVYTPFAQATLARDTPVDPLLPRGSELGVSTQKNFYHPAFGLRLGTAYSLQPELPLP